MSERLEKKIRFVARAFIWEGRFHKARQLHQMVKGHKRTAREAVDAMKWWGRLLLPRDEREG